jgi:hypothetical protein
MSATKIGNTGVPLPRISRIRAFPDFRVSVIWAEGSRTGAADTVDLAPVINTYKFYRPLRKNKELFRTAHIVDNGYAIAWGGGTIDMSAELIEDIAHQAMTPKDFASTGPIPRVIALARYRQEARQKASDPALSLSAQGGGGRASWLSGLLTRASQDEPARGGGRPGWLSEILTRASQDEPARGGGRAGGLSEVLTRASQDEPARGGGRAGWLSEPLTRAPQDEPARGGGAPARDPDAGTPHTVESLDTLAVDIARMVDHDAVAELWDRYKRGEGNVFTRMLYTMQGQEAFEEVRRKYRGNRDFMRTVERYIGEFERLLEDLSYDDHGRMLARTYLTSEMGEVYTMLAHAAGRFD